MLDYIKGTIEEATPTYVVLDNRGMGYMLNISLTTYETLQSACRGEVKVYVYEAIREDAHVLYGFAEKRERELFELLISVSGVGTNTARMILSSLPPQELETTIATGNAASLKSVKGVGAKTAQRIIVDLKDKINVVGTSLLDKVPMSNEVYDEAMAALTMLGFTKQATQKVLNSLFKENPAMKVEEAIKKALKQL